MTASIKFEHNSFGKRLKSMLAVDFRRMFTSRLFYVMLGVCLAVPILTLVMTGMMGGSAVDPQTGAAMSSGTFENTWQFISSVSENGAGMSMDMTTMCNINLLYFGLAVLVCMFVSDDFKSGYAKNLFAVRSKKGDYIVSKTLVFLVSGVLLLAAALTGGMLGGAIGGLSFTLDGITAGNLVMCILSKLFLTAVFIPIFLCMSIVAKQKTWMAILGSLVIGVLLFMMIPMLTPLNATTMNVVMCLIGGLLLSVGLGAVGTLILGKSDLI